MSYPTKYIDILKKIYDQNLFFAVKMGLENMKEFDRLLGNPSQKFRSVHVTGTNGKGSVTCKIANALQLSGYKTGVFVSPHISCFRERITVNGKMISEREIEDMMPEIFQKCDKIGNLSFFELITGLAYKYFAEKKIDVGVIEVGLGGRLDATNIINSEMSVITSIGLDHQGILGSTIQEIAREKSGIIKRGKPVVVGPQCPYSQIKGIADALDSPSYYVSQVGSTFDETNQLISKKALSVLQEQHLFDLTEEAIQKGVQTRPICRFEELDIPVGNTKKRVILDVGHNRLGIQNFLKTLQYKYPNKRYKTISGFCADKNIADCIDEMLNVIPIENMNIIKASHPRGMKPEQLRATIQHCAEQKNIEWKESYVPYDTIPNTIDRELKRLKEDEVLIINGSLYIMGEVRNALGIQEPLDLCLDYAHKKQHQNHCIADTILFPNEKPVQWN